MNKLKIYHFHNGCGGGVLSVIKNLLQFSNNPYIENHIIHAVNKKQIPEYKIDHIEGAITQQVFYYSQKNNFYYTCRQLEKLVPNSKAIIIAHDWIELGMVSNLGLQNLVVQYLHGDYDYYYELAKKNKESIDLFIAVSDNIKLNLQKKIRERESDIKYFRFPVPQAYSINKKPNIIKNIIFLGRLTEEKGYYFLPEIAKKVNDSLIKIKWHIVGSNIQNKEENKLWDKDIDVQFYGNIENDKVQILLTEMDFYILPSIAEGMPVSLIEAMKACVVPLVNNLEGGVNELVQNGITGFLINNNDINEYVNKLIWLAKNETICLSIGKASKEKAEYLFNPIKNVEVFEKSIFELNVSKIKIPLKKYGSRLDQPWLPNKITQLLRK